MIASCCPSTSVVMSCCPARSCRSLFGALFTFPNEYRMLKKERPAGMYK